MMKRHSVWKLCFKLILAGIPLYLLMLYTFLFPMNYMAIEYSMWAEEKDYVNKENGAENLPTANTLILGDSRAKSGLRPKELSDSVYNMAIGGATPIEMYYALENYLENHPAPENAVIIFAPYHFCDIDNWGQTLYYNYLTVPELLDVFKNAASFNDPVVLADNFLTDSLSYRLRLPNKYLAAEYNAGFVNRKNDNLEKYNSVRRDGGYTVFGTAPGNDAGNYETHHEVFDKSPLVENYYYKLIGLCLENDIHVIIEQSPVNKASMALITEDFWDGYNQFLADIETAYPSIIMEKEVIAYDNRYFGDNNHLNEDGAVIFTREFKEKYKELFSAGSTEPSTEIPEDARISD